MIEQIKPMDIEKRSFEIITEILGDTQLDPENELVIKRVIHTTADFEYVQNLVSPIMLCAKASRRCEMAATSSPIPRWQNPVSIRPS